MNGSALRLSLLLFSAVLMLLCGCRNSSCILTESRLSDVESRILQNAYIQTEIVPKACGGIVRLKYLPADRELLEPFSYTVEKIDLLPEISSAGGGGDRTLFWQKRNLWACPMNITGEENTGDRCSLEMSSRYYQSFLWSMKRRIDLQHDAAAIGISISFTNRDRKTAAITPWENFIAGLVPGKMDTVLIPARGKIKHVNNQGVQEVPEDSLLLDSQQDGFKDRKASPARPWIAQYNPESPLIIVMRVQEKAMKPDGFFYSWKSREGYPRHTMEAVFSPLTLKSGETRTLSLEYLFFEGLKRIREISGYTGIDCRQEGRSLIISLGTAKKNAAGNLKIFLENAQGRKHNLGIRSFGCLIPGRTSELSYLLPSEVKNIDDWQISGTFSDGKSFTLLNFLQQKQ